MSLSPLSSSSANAPHIPVLIEEVLSALAIQPGETHVDGTYGAGGYSRAMAERGAHVVAIDRDPDAIAEGRERIADEGGDITLLEGPFSNMVSLLAEAGVGQVDGVTLDIGVSSMQLDRAERGFAYAQDAPLDMRMDPDSPLTAADIVNTYDQAELADILHRYGEERFARRIAAQIVRRRARAPFTSTAELVELLYQAIPAPARRTGGHPAKRTFQALRIAVNDELDSLRRALPAALDALAGAGRIVVLSYQSLEDRIVKRAFAETVATRTPLDLPVELPGHGPRFRSLTRGAERAEDAEIQRNPRSAAVRLRALQRVEDGVEAARHAIRKGDS